jgi:ssRNA-specific RNase YbeY (16S rRNA maturation enzyme)
MSCNDSLSVFLPLSLFLSLLVNITNQTKKYQIDLKSVEDDLNILRTILKVRDFQVDVTFCSLNRIKKLNQQFREKPQSTDVLSFSVQSVSDTLLWRE